MNYKHISKTVEDWISLSINSTKTKGVVIGVSGGIDAAVAVALSVRALGPERVSCVIIQTTGNEEEFRDGLEICKAYNVVPIIIDFQKIYKDMQIILPAAGPMVEGNYRDRLRSAILYYIANLNNSLVISTVNKNEYLLGYFCKNGSGMADLMPIADIYKSDIWNLARYLGVPNHIISKQPTGDYWPGQTDEEVIGVKYSEQELYIQDIEKGSKKSISTPSFMTLLNLHNNSSHKRKTIPRCILSENLNI